MTFFARTRRPFLLSGRLRHYPSRPRPATSCPVPTSPEAPLDREPLADDPFTHEDFRDRLGKLLRLLSSDHEAEAEAARRKLLQHLAHHGVSLNDLTAHLGDVHDGAHHHEHGTPATPDALRYAAARAQRAEAAQRAAEQMNVRLLASAEALRRQARTAWSCFGALAGLGIVGAAVLLAMEVWHAKEPATSVQQIAPRMSDAVTSPALPVPAASRQPDRWAGTIQQPAELLDNPDSAAQRRAMLDAGTRVLVLGSGPTWLQVRTGLGSGYVLKGLVRPDR